LSSGSKKQKTNEADKEKIIDKLLKDKKYKEAIKKLRKFIYDEPTNYKYFYKMSEIYNQMNMYNSAIEYIDKAILLNNVFYKAYYVKGEILTKLGNFKEAKKVFKHIVDNDSKDSKYYKLSKNMLEILSGK
jgi:predicted Zn-dependent protease